VTAGADFFFEIKAESVAADGTAIGFAHAEYELGVDQVGWQADSYGYHSDDGGVFAQDDDEAQTLPTWGAGDSVGCGYEAASQSIYFTKNGSRVGSISNVKITKPLYPAVTSSVERIPAIVQVLAPASSKLKEPKLVGATTGQP
jgi:hypothetical protein